MSYKTEKPREVEAQIAKDGVDEKLGEAYQGTQVLCLVCSRTEYTRVYVVIPRKRITSVTIDDADTYTRTMEANRVTTKFRAEGAKVETNFG
jgi:hypothetical protein